VGANGWRSFLKVKLSLVTITTPSFSNTWLSRYEATAGDGARKLTGIEAGIEKRSGCLEL
jgi:hypothetical protein